MNNYEIFNTIIGEETQNYMKDGVEVQQVVTSKKVLLVGRVKAIKTAETKKGKPMATLVLSAGAERYDIQDDGSILKNEPTLDDEGNMPAVFIQFYDSNNIKGNKAYSGLMKMVTPKTEGKQAAVTQDKIVMVKAVQQIKTNDDGSQFTTYMGSRVYISGVAEVQDKTRTPEYEALLGSVTLFENEGEYSLSMPMNMQNPVTGAYDVTCYINCVPKGGVFTPEMIQSFAKREHCARVVLGIPADKYMLDATNPIKPTCEVEFENWMVIPEFIEGEIGSGMGTVVTAE